MEANIAFNRDPSCIRIDGPRNELITLAPTLLHDSSNCYNASGNYRITLVEIVAINLFVSPLCPGITSGKRNWRELLRSPSDCLMVYFTLKFSESMFRGVAFKGCFKPYFNIESVENAADASNPMGFY